MIKISIVMPAYNAAQHIGTAIQSVCAQTFTNWELIVIDDASSDVTVDIVESMVVANNRIMLYKNQYNLGVAASRNRGLQLCSGDYIAFLDSDDIWDKEKLSKQLAVLEQTQADFCFTSYTIILEPGKVLSVYNVPQTIDYNGLLKENVIGCSTVLLKRSVLGKRCFADGYFHEDYVLWLQLLKAGCKAIGMQSAVVLYRVGGRSHSKMNAAKQRWYIYRNCEHLSLVKAGYYFLCYCWRGFLKHAIM